MIFSLPWIAFLILLLMITYKSFNLKDKLVNPVTIIILVWIIIISLHSYIFKETSYTYQLYNLITLNIILIFFGFYITKLKPSIKRTYTKYDYNFVGRLIKIFLCFDFLRLVYSTYIMVGIFSNASIFYFFENTNAIRFLYLDYEANILEKIFSFICNSTVYIGYVLLGIYFANKGKNHIKYLILASIIEITYSIMTISKLSLILFLISFMISYLNSINDLSKQRKIITRIIPMYLIIMISFFFVIGILRNYADTKGDLVSGVMDGIIYYMAGPTEALGKIISNNAIFGQHNMVDIGAAETNVFTYFYIFKDADDLIRYALCPLITGLVFGYIYNNSRNSLFADVSSVWISVFTAFSFFDFLLRYSIFSFILLYAYVLQKMFFKKLYLR